MLLPMSHGVPIGTIVAFALDVKQIPSGWLLCDGKPIDSKKYPKLGPLMKSTPNLCGRTLIGVGTTNIQNGATYSLGQSGGEENHQLTIDEMPEHGHSINWGNFGLHHRSFKGDDGDDVPYETNPDTRLGGVNPSGNNQPHNNMQPYYVVNYIIYAGE